MMLSVDARVILMIMILHFVAVAVAVVVGGYCCHHCTVDDRAGYIIVTVWLLKRVIVANVFFTVSGPEREI